MFEKRGFIIIWKELEKQSLDETINALAMASPFTIEEKQVLLETKNLKTRKTKISEILLKNSLLFSYETIPIRKSENKWEKINKNENHITRKTYVLLSNTM